MVHVDGEGEVKEVDFLPAILELMKQDQEVLSLSKSLHNAQRLHKAIVMATKELKKVLAIEEKQGKGKAKDDGNVFKIYSAQSYPEVTQEVVFDAKVDDPLTAIMEQLQELNEE